MSVQNFPFKSDYKTLKVESIEIVKNLKPVLSGKFAFQALGNQPLRMQVQLLQMLRTFHSLLFISQQIETMHEHKIQELYGLSLEYLL